MDSRGKRWYILALLALAQFMTVLDVSIVNVALPSIQKTLALTQSNLQWVATAYTLAFGGFLLLGGRAADLYGRRRVFMVGVFGFTTISLLIGLTQSGALLIVLRALQGFSAAFMSPSALSMVLRTFDEGADRNRALSVWAAVAAAGASTGVLLGGVLTQYLSWRYNFFINVPVGYFVLAMSFFLLPAYASEERSKTLDLPGAMLVTSAFILLVYTLANAVTWGWLAAPTLILFLISAGLFVVFVFNESRAAHPLVPLSIFKVGNVTGANVTLFLIAAGFYSALFLVTLYLQDVRHYSPLITGLAFLPTTLTFATFSTLAPNIIRRVGYDRLLVVAPLLAGVSLLILGSAPVGGSYWIAVLPAMLILPMGIAPSFVASNIAATAGVPGSETGLASGLISSALQTGGSVGLAVLSSISASTTALLLARHSTQTDALLGGFHDAFHVAVLLAVFASISATLLIRHPLKTGRAAVCALSGHFVPAREA